MKRCYSWISVPCALWASACGETFEQTLTEVTPSSVVEDTAVQIVVPPVVDTADTDPPEPPEPLALGGRYADQWGTTYDFTAKGWSATLGASTNEHVLSAWSNADTWLVGQNAESNALHPNRWTKLQWLWSDDLLFLCQLTNSAETEKDALQRVPADTTSPATQGCNAAPWLSLTPIAALSGARR